MNTMICKSSPTSEAQKDQLLLDLQRQVDTLSNRLDSLTDMMRQISIGETGIISKEFEMYHKENERKKKKKELKKKKNVKR
jgi:hypothetical protein